MNRNPEVYSIWTNWASCKLQRDEVDETIKLLEESQKHVGHNSSGLMTLAVTSYMKKDTIQAVEYMAEAFELDADNSIIVSNYLGSLVSIKDYLTALEIYDKVHWDELKGKEIHEYDAKNYVIIAYNNLGEHEEALSLIRKSISEVDYNMFYVRCAETHAYQGQIDSFYYYLEVAFEKGYQPKWLIKRGQKDSDNPDYEEPHNRFANEQRFIRLFEKYQKNKPLKG